MKNILIVGGTGVLSSAVTNEAISQGFNVTMINRGKHHVPDNVELIKADKDDLETIAQKLVNKRFDAVMDYLCYTDEQTERSVSFYSKYTNQYFYISSCAVYDTANLNGKKADEDDKKVLSIWKYSVDKWASEQKLKSMLNGSGINYTIIRPSVTYGDTRIPYGITPLYGYHWTMCARILAGKPIIRWNSGQNRCNLTRVEDFAVGVVGLIGNPKAYNEAFNVCGDEAPTWNEVLDVLSELLGKDVITVDIPSDFYANHLPERAGEILGGRSIDTLNSNKKIKDAVPAFAQRIGLKEGIAKTIKAYKDNNYQRGIDWNFDASTDRVIRKWCKQNRMETKDYNLHFIDYLGSATKSQKIEYWTILHKENVIVKTVSFLSKIARKVLR